MTDPAKDIDITEVHIDITEKNEKKKSAVTQDTPRECCEECKTNEEKIKLLKTDLQSKQEKIQELTSHVHMLETDHPTTNKKRRYGDIGHDEMHNEMVNDSADKDITIGNLKAEKNILITRAKEIEATHNAAMESLQKKNAELSLKLVELERTSKIGSRAVDNNNKKDAETKSLKEQVILLNEKLAERETTLDETLKTLNEKDWKENHQEKEPSNTSILSEMQKIIENKFNHLESTISIIVEKKLDEKQVAVESTLENVIKKSTLNATSDENMQDITIPISTTKQIQSYAESTNKKNVTPGTNFRAIMLATKNEELAEETERKRRGQNLIIHGKEEIPSNDDKEFINQMITDLQIGAVKFKQMERLGNINVGKMRPIKLVFNNEEDQQKVFNNLRNLKGKTYYKGISVKEDYTYNERLLIKQFAEQAKAQNIEEERKNSNIIWRVRGTPKNGLTIKWFTKNQRETTTTLN